MKPKIVLYALALLISSAGCGKRSGQTLQLGALQLSSRTPKPGETIEIAYLPNHSNLKGTQGIRAVLYHLVGRDIYAQAVAMQAKNDTLEATIQVPDSAQALVFKFTSKYKTDNNGDKGYVIPLYGKDDRVLPGAKAAIGDLYLEFGRSNFLDIKHDADDALARIDSDIRAHPELKKAWQEAYLTQYYRSNREVGKGLIEARIDQLEAQADLDEDGLSSLRSFYHILADREKYDSVNQILIAKFPHGKAAAIQALRKIIQTKDLTKATALYEQYKTEFGNGTHSDQDRVISRLAQQLLHKGNLEAAMRIASDMHSRSRLMRLYNNMAWPLAEKGKRLEKAQEISQKSLELVEEVKAELTEKPTYMTAGEYRAEMESRYAAYADTYALILFKRGKIREAIAYESKVAGTAGADPEVNQRYIQFLLADKQYDQALAHAQQYMESGVSTSGMQAYLKEAYQKAHHSLKGYEALLTKVKATQKKQAMAAAKREMIDKPAPHFSLKDLKGNEVSLTSLKGKVVVLDFWATWCHYCIASFPAMQKAVDKYKNDDTVEFLFVNTLENGKNAEARKKRAQDFTARNPYTFHIVMDEEKPLHSKQFQVAQAYGVHGIPAKFIIGPEGHIKFAKSGYGGDESALLREIEAMVALAQGKG